MQRRRPEVLVPSQGIAEQHSHRVHREAEGRNDVHAVGHFGDLRQADAEENVNRKFMNHGDVEAPDGRQNRQPDNRLNAASRPLPQSDGQKGCGDEQLHVDAGVVRVGETDGVVAEPILEEEKIAPPIFLADVGVRRHHQVPHGSRAHQREDERAEENQKDDRRNDSDVAVEDFPPHDDLATSLQTSDERVSC